MNAEQRWADNQEWAQERGEIEIKSETKFPKDLCICGDAGELHQNAANCYGPACSCKELREAAIDCAVQHCGNDAIGTVVVGRVQNRSGHAFDLCAEHWEEAFELFQRAMNHD